MSTDDQKKEVFDAAGDAAVQWRNGNVPFSPRFADTYFSDVDGRAETREVFLGGNGLPARWDRGETFTIAELGFGTGLNFLETARHWLQCAPPGATLRFISFERFPMNHADIMKVLAVWPDLVPLALTYLVGWPGKGSSFSVTRDGVSLEVRLGDARTLIEDAAFVADAWYLDGFSPAQNPELWDEDLLACVFSRTAPGGTFSTYTAAGWVRRNLQTAGFAVERVPGYGRKRERLQGVRTTAGAGAIGSHTRS